MITKERLNSLLFLHNIYKRNDFDTAQLTYMALEIIDAFLSSELRKVDQMPHTFRLETLRKGCEEYFASGKSIGKDHIISEILEALDSGEVENWKNAVEDLTVHTQVFMNESGEMKEMNINNNGVCDILERMNNEGFEYMGKR
jgi:hypothetical protein